jgi:hypothetical protein
MGVVEFTTMGADPSPGKSSARNPAAWLRLGRGLSTIIGLMDPRAFGLELGTDALATAFDGIVHHPANGFHAPKQLPPDKRAPYCLKRSFRTDSANLGTNWTETWLPARRCGLAGDLDERALQDRKEEVDVFGLADERRAHFQ